MIDGRRIIAEGKAASTAASPSPLVRAYSLSLPASAPMAEIWTSRSTPASAASRAMRPAPSACTPSNFCLLSSARMPTQFTTAVAP